MQVLHVLNFLISGSRLHKNQKMLGMKQFSLDSRIEAERQGDYDDHFVVFVEKGILENSRCNVCLIS